MKLRDFSPRLVGSTCRRREQQERRRSHSISLLTRMLGLIRLGSFKGICDPFHTTSGDARTGAKPKKRGELTLPIVKGLYRRPLKALVSSYTDHVPNSCSSCAPDPAFLGWGFE